MNIMINEEGLRMRIVILATILCIVMIATNLYSESFMIVEVQEDLSTAILLDQDTGQEWEVAVGDMIGEWTVEEITTGFVSISKIGDDGMVLMTKIPSLSGSFATPVISVESP